MAHTIIQTQVGDVFEHLQVRSALGVQMDLVLGHLLPMTAATARLTVSHCDSLHTASEESIIRRLLDTLWAMLIALYER